MLERLKEFRGAGLALLGATLLAGCAGGPYAVPSAAYYDDTPVYVPPSIYVVPGPVYPRRPSFWGPPAAVIIPGHRGHGWRGGPHPGRGSWGGSWSGRGHHR